MADNSQQIADSLKGINSSLETFTNLSKQMEERLSDIADSSSGIRDDYGAIEKHQEKIVKETKNWGGAFKGVVESAGKVASFVGSAVMVTGLADAFRTTLKLDQSMKNLSAGMGLGVENAKKLYNTVTDVAFAVGASAEDAEAMVTGMVKARVAAEEIGKASKGMLLFSRVTGMVNDESQQLYSNLRKVAGMGQNDVLKFASTFAQVQRKVGMTEQEMSILSDSVQETAYRLSAFGQSPAQIEKMSKGVVGLAAGFVKVGLSAQKAVELVDQLTDPTRLEDNIGLYAQLGISIQDAMSGAIDPTQMTQGLQDFAERVKSMGPIAGAQFAKSMGQNYNDLMKMANGLNDEVKDAMAVNESDDPMKTIAAMAKQQEGLQLTVEKFINRINAVIISLRPVLIGLALFVTGVILPKIFSKMRKESLDTTDTVAKGVKGTLMMGLEKSWVKTSERIKGIGKNISEDYKKRLLESSGYVSAQMSADFLNVLGSVNQFKLGKNFAKGAEDFTRWMAGSAKPASLTASLVKSMRDRQDELLNLSLRDRRVKEEVLKIQSDTVKEALRENSVRRDSLAPLIVYGKATAAQKSEYRAILKAMGEAKKELAEIGIKQADLGEASAIMEKHWERMTTEHLADTLATMNKQTSSLTEQKNQGGIRIKQLEEEKDVADYLAKRAEEELKTDKALLSNESSLAQMSIEEVQAIQKRMNANKDILSQQSQLTKALEEEQKIYDGIENQLKDEQVLQDKITNIINARDENSLGSEGKLYKGFNNILRTFTGELMANTRASLANFTDKVKNTASTIKDSISTGFKEATKHPIRTAVQGLGGIGQLAKVMGIAAIGMTLLNKVLEPFLGMLQEQLGPVLDILVTTLQPIVEVLIKSLLPPLLRILAALVPPLVGLLKIIATVLTPVIVGVMKLLKFILGWIPGIGDAIGGITDGISDAMTGVNDSLQKMDTKGLQNSLNNAADGIAKSDSTNRKLVEQGEKKAEPAVYNASASQGFTQVAAGTAPISTSPAQKAAETAKTQATVATADSTIRTADNTEVMNKLLSKLNKTMENVDASITELVGNARAQSARSSLANASAYSPNAL